MNENLKDLLEENDYYKTDDVLDTAKLKEIISETCLDGIDLLDAVDPKFKKRFEKACSDLSKVVSDMRKEFPDANIYVNDDQVVLMLGHTHDKSKDIISNRELEALTSHKLLGKIDGGGW